MQQDVLDQIGVALEAHLLQNPAAVRADGLDAQAQLVGDLRHGLAFPDVEQNLVFPVGEALVGQLVVVLGHLLDHEAGQFGADVLLALHDGAHGVFEDLRTVVLFYNKYNSVAEARQINPETGQPFGPPPVPETLAEVELTEGPALKDREIDAIVAFLKTLTDQRYEHLLAEN